MLAAANETYDDVMGGLGAFEAVLHVILIFNVNSSQPKKALSHVTKMQN